MNYDIWYDQRERLKVELDWHLKTYAGGAIGEGVPAQKENNVLALCVEITLRGTAGRGEKSSHWEAVVKS